MKTNIFFFIFLAIIFCKVSFSNVMYNMPERMLLQEVNPNVKQKTQTQYKSVEQIKNQYKGRLKYRPANDGISNYRYKRVYTNFYASTNNFSIKSMLFRNVVQNTSTLIEKISAENSYEMNIVGGYYMTNSMAIELEYVNLNYLIELKRNRFLTDSNGILVNKINTSFSAYTVNLMVENNYSKIIPFFGFGVGYLNNNYSKLYDTSISDITEVVGSNIIVKSKPIYTMFAGIEYAFSNKFLLSFRYKNITTVSDGFLKSDKSSGKSIIDLSTKINIMSLGVKYIW